MYSIHYEIDLGGSVLLKTFLLCFGLLQLSAGGVNIYATHYSMAI